MFAKPEVLYHYTTSAGLLGILESGELWATDVYFLNDAEELFHAAKPASEALNAKADQLRALLKHDEPEFPHRPLLAVIEGLIQRLRELQEGGRLWGEVFVSCFCEDGDLLSQWRAYSGSGGYALGFDAGMLPPTQTNEYMGTNLARVNYGLAEAVEEIEALIDGISPGSGNHPGILAEHVFLSLLRQLAQVKNPGFSEEREWRLLTISDDKTDLYFRDGPLGLIPFKRRAFPPEALISITIGPGGSRVLRDKSVRHLIERFQPSRQRQIDINVSQVPLR